MNCKDLPQALVGDAADDLQAAERHAATCEACAKLLEADRRLLATTHAWKRSTPAPALDLERRLAAAIRADGIAAEDTDGRVVKLKGRLDRDWESRRVLKTWRWVSAAAVLALALAGLSVLLNQTWRANRQSNDPLAVAVRQIEKAERDFVAAIAELEKQTAVVLARSGDPALPPDQAAILIAYRDRLSHLDSVLADVAGFLEENPGHGGGYSVLLAAYKEKREVMQEVLALDLGETS